MKYLEHTLCASNVGERERRGGWRQTRFHQWPREVPKSPLFVEISRDPEKSIRTRRRKKQTLWLKLDGERWCLPSICRRRQRVPPVGEKKRVPPVASAVAVDFTGEDRIAFVVAVERGGEIVFFIRVTGKKNRMVLIHFPIFPLFFFFIRQPFLQIDFHIF